MTSELENKVISQLARWNNGICPGGQVLIEKDGDILWEQALGYANLENEVPITSESIFHIASISKQFTVMALLLLQQDGKLSLDDPVDQYLGDLMGGLKSYQEKHGKIRLHHLCNNTSGLRDIWELLQLEGYLMTDTIQASDATNLVCHQQALNFAPGEKYMYSNTGFFLLALVVERLSGLTFAQFVHERIFEPLGMHKSIIRENCHELIPKQALSYLDEGEAYFYYPLNYAVAGPTSVNTCASDLIKVLQEYQKPSLLTENNVKFMLSPARTNDGKTIEYCGGLMQHKLGKYKVIEHSGADAAYRANMLWLPEKDLKIILLSNTNTYLMQQKAHEIALLILQDQGQSMPGLGGRAVDDLSANAKSSPAETGAYVSEQDGIPRLIELLKHEGEICLRRELTVTPLRLSQDQRFYTVGRLDEQLTFTQDGLNYHTPSSTLAYKKSKQVEAGYLPCGKYYLVEHESTILEIEDHEGYLYLKTIRNGTAPLYQLDNERAIFTFGPEFTFSLQLNGDFLELNGDRVRHILARKL